MTTATQATIYTTTHCQQCRVTFRHMDRKGIVYEAVNLDEQPHRRAEIEAYGYMQVPIVVTADGEHWSGFNPDKLNELAAIASRASDTVLV